MEASQKSTEANAMITPFTKAMYAEILDIFLPMLISYQVAIKVLRGVHTNPTVLEVTIRVRRTPLHGLAYLRLNNHG
jgi:hypothetical protein